MSEEHGNAGAQPVAAVVQEPQSQEDNAYANETSSQAASDGWGDALEAFEEADGAEQPQHEEAQTQESESKSNFEQDPQQTEGGLDLEKLAVPHKFKERVKEYVAPLIQEHQRKAEAAEQQAGQYLEASRGFVNVFKEIAKNPAKIAEYVEQYGAQFGLEPDVIQKYSQYRSRGAQTQNGQKPPVAEAQNNVDAIFTKYADKLAKASEAGEFVGTLKSLIAESLSVKESQMTEAFKQMLGGYHEQIVSPNIKTLEQAKAQAQHTAKVGSWNEAHASVKSKYKDFDVHDAGVRKLLKENPLFAGYREALNANPDALLDRGITHESLIDHAYQLVSRQAHIEQARQPAARNWEGGLQPSAKHINTTKAGGSDWDEIKKSVYGD